MVDERYMQRCLQLARLGRGYVAPNPMVGAVLVYQGRIIGEGYHRQYGGPHAEVNCINSVVPENIPNISKSTLYVSLEPCVHFGKTPPCSDLIIRAGIPNVVIGCTDPFAAVNGQGVKKLRNAGIQVVTGILEKESVELNERFFCFHQKHRPFLILKWAQSNDKKIAGLEGKRIFISNEATNRLVHKWRTEEAAVLVGTNTALLDDPGLTARLWPGQNPLRLVIDMELRLPVSLQLFDGKEKTIVFNLHTQEEGDRVIYCKIDPEQNIIMQVLAILYRLQVQSVIVEGGAKLLQSFIDADLWDEVRIITNTQLTIGNGIAAPVLPHCKIAQTNQIQTDLIHYYIPIH